MDYFYHPIREHLRPFPGKKLGILQQVGFDSIVWLHFLPNKAGLVECGFSDDPEQSSFGDHDGTEGRMNGRYKKDKYR